jgi:hypothetical protein
MEETIEPHCMAQFHYAASPLHRSDFDQKQEKKRFSFVLRKKLFHVRADPVSGNPPTNIRYDDSTEISHVNS